MSVLDIADIKNVINDLINEYEIKKVDLFGSYASGKPTSKSDIDLLVEFKSQTISLITLAKLKYELEERLDKSVDIIHGPLNIDSILTVEEVIKLYEQ